MKDTVRDQIQLYIGGKEGRIVRKGRLIYPDLKWGKSGGSKPSEIWETLICLTKKTAKKTRRFPEEGEGRWVRGGEEGEELKVTTICL